ncbi:MAG: cbb3-type cytochrome c oxidase subunit I [Acidobacteria bacterium]|nr:cbb3-type cytochrome c oxidase subunit I [Acidobacteriota bacterium]
MAVIAERAIATDVPREASFNYLVVRYWLTALAAFFVAAVIGLVLRWNQASGFLSLAWHYRLQTFHGAYMAWFAIASVAGFVWLLIRKQFEIVVPRARMELVYWLLLAGAGLFGFGVLIGGFAPGFPILPPLPLNPAGAWAAWAVNVSLSGMVLIVVATIAYLLEWLVAAHRAAGGLGQALGLSVFLPRGANPGGRTVPPYVLAVTAMALIGMYALPVGAYLVANILLKNNFPAVPLDPLFAKNMLWAFAHTLVNILYWGTFGIVYLLIPVITDREWKLYRLLVILWLVTIVTTGMTAMGHHLQLDPVPFSIVVIGQVGSYLSIMSWAAVSIYGAVERIWKSGITWEPKVSFLYFGMFMVLVGMAGAYLDAGPGFNTILHNTLWVPAHFHSYMMLGMALFIFACMYHYVPLLTRKTDDSTALPRVHFWMTAIGGVGLVGSFYLAGLLGTPRRMAAYPLDALPALAGLVTQASVPFALVLALAQAIPLFYLTRMLVRRA